LISHFKLSKRSQEDNTNSAPESIEVEAISGHLDSNNPAKRNLDFSIIHDALSNVESISDFQALVDTIPNIRVSGYDANTRNVIDENNQVLNAWTDDAKTLGIRRGLLGTAVYSNPSTYKSHQPDNEWIPSPDTKRQGMTKGGPLDSVSILDGGQTITIGVDVSQATKTDSIDGQDRDHAVIIIITEISAGLLK